METAMKRWPITIPALLFLFWATGIEAGPSQGERARSVSLIQLDGESVELEKQWGEGATLIAFMAPRCLPCKESIPGLQAIAREYGASQGLEVLRIYLTDERGLESVKEADTAQPNLRIFRDVMENGYFAAARAYGVMGTPTFILVGPDGTVQWTHVGRLPEISAPGGLEGSLMKYTMGSRPSTSPSGDRVVAQEARK